MNIVDPMKNTIAELSLEQYSIFYQPNFRIYEKDPIRLINFGKNLVKTQHTFTKKIKT